jgi:uncharacterized membrane protein
VNSTKSRSLAKSLTWRLVAIVSTFIIAYFMTGDLTFATSLTIISNIINFVLYYFHERIWLQVRWGRE